MSNELTPEIREYFASLARKRKGIKLNITEESRQRRRDNMLRVNAARRAKAGKPTSVAGGVVQSPIRSCRASGEASGASRLSHRIEQSSVRHDVGLV